MEKLHLKPIFAVICGMAITMSADTGIGKDKAEAEAI